ncbi:MAG: HAD-IA family hydrolase [Chloroflexi bacterium]|nr:HAD-IA family hydrolase [Chloroflexota bacterium]
MARAYREVPEASALVQDISRRVATRIIESYEQQELQELDLVELFDHALRVVGLELPPDLVRSIAEMEHRALVGKVAAPPENLAVLQTLKDRGLRLGLVSNATLLPEMMHQDIERLGIATFMDHAVFSSEARVRKPHPAIFTQVLDALGTAPEEAIFVGDRLHDDIGGAQRVGMGGVLTRQYRQEDVDASPTKPDHVIERLPDLLPYVESLLDRKVAAS